MTCLLTVYTCPFCTSTWSEMLSSTLINKLSSAAEILIYLSCYQDCLKCTVNITMRVACFFNLLALCCLVTDTNITPIYYVNQTFYQKIAHFDLDCRLYYTYMWMHVLPRGYMSPTMALIHICSYSFSWLCTYICDYMKKCRCCMYFQW